MNDEAKERRFRMNRRYAELTGEHSVALASYAILAKTMTTRIPIPKHNC